MATIIDKTGKIWKFIDIEQAIEFVRSQGDYSYETFADIMLGNEVVLK